MRMIEEHVMATTEVDIIEYIPATGRPKQYVAGFLFSPEKTQVALVRKTRPAWQAGKLNAIGGKREEGETPLEAMVREFREETGVEHGAWNKFAELHGDVCPDKKASFVVHFYVGTRALHEVRTTTDEEILIVSSIPMSFGNYLPNVPWLMAMARVYQPGQAVHRIHEGQGFIN